jgi:DNA helicase-2/ATP-dependent DNA helicase PcrA
MPKKSSPKIISLNEEQQEVVSTRTGYFKVFAGPGAGKSQCLSSRYAELIKEGVSPDDILSLSFTSTASKNLRDRVESLVGKITENRIAGARTFHSLSLAFSQEERLEFPFTLAENVLCPEPVAYKIAAESGRRFEVDPRSLRAEISLWKRSRVSPAQAVRNCETGEIAEAKKLKLALGYKEYEKRCKESGILDFDSLIFWAVQLMDKNPDIRARWNRDWIQIDEAQDLSKIEWDLVRLISGHSVIAVGDLSQNLYSFRGSDSRLFRDMEEIFPGTQTLFLGRNYRSSPEIVEYIRPLAVSQDLAEKFHTTNEPGPSPEIKGFTNSFDEAMWIAKRIKENL